MTKQAQLPTTEAAPPAKNPRFTGKIGAIEQNAAIGEGLEWVKLSDLVGEDVLILATQFRMRTDKDTGEEYEEVVVLYRMDDASLEPENRFSTRASVVMKTLRSTSLPVVATIHKQTNAKRPYYYLDRPEWATDADGEPAF